MTSAAGVRSGRWPWIVVGAGATATLVFAMISPADAVQGNLVRIMYVHVPAAWLAYLAFTVTLVGSIGYLISKSLAWDRTAAASAEVGVYFTGLTILLGMIWGKPTWGVWWTWDARLTLTAIMFFVYLGYLALRRTTTDPHSRARRSSILGVLAIVQVPLVHFSVTWWRTLHQPPSLIRPDGPQIDEPLMLTALLVGVLSFTAIYIALLAKRVELARLEDAIDEAERAADRPVAGEAVTAPELGRAQ
jgi:heme exporter protein C